MYVYVYSTTSGTSCCDCEAKADWKEQALEAALLGYNIMLGLKFRI